MGFVTEQIEHDELPVTLMTVEREAGETVEAWRFVSLEFDHFERLTPPELRKIGRWLVQEGKRIGKEYKSNGAMKTPSNVEFSGGAPLHGAASAGTKGYESGGVE